MGHDKAGGLVLVVDEAQKLANKHVLADRIMNIFCGASSYGPVILIASDYNVPQFLKRMSHIHSRTTVIFARTATKEEMLPHVRARFGDQVAQQVVDSFDGAFSLLELMDRMDPKEAVGANISKVREKLKDQIIDSLELTENGMKMAERAACTGGAMVAAATLAFGAGTIWPL